MGIFCEIIFPGDIWSYTCLLLSAWLPKCELNIADTNGHTKVDGGKVHKTSTTQSCEQLKKYWEWKKGPSSGKTTMGFIVSDPKKYTQGTLCEISKLYLEMNMYM